MGGAALTPRTKALLLGCPCNPTGAVYNPEELRDLGEWAAAEGLWVITDETYEHFVSGGVVAVSLPALVPAIGDRWITISGVAKPYAITGWRVGWLVAPANVAKAVATFQSHATSHAGNIAQAAALAALEAGLAPVEAVRKELDRRRLRLCASLGKLPRIDVVEPSGGVYAFPSVAACLGGQLAGKRINTAIDLAGALLEYAGVAVVPGEAFGTVGHLRASFALSDDDLDEGIARLVAGLREAMADRG